MKHTLTISLLLTFSINAFSGILSEEECIDVDIRESNPKIKNNQELKEHFSLPRHQDSIGWCHAFVAADLVSAEIGIPVSALHASTQYNNHIQESFFLRNDYKITNILQPGTFQSVYEGGSIDKAIKVISKNGKICSEKDLPFDSHHDNETYQLIEKLEKLKQQIKAKKLVYEEVCSELNQTLPLSQFENLNIESLAQSLIEKDLNITLNQMATQKCQSNMVEVPKFKLTKLSPPKPTSKEVKIFFEKINLTLNKGRPLAFEYNLKHFTINSGVHFSINTARRWKNGQCEYKIRNSWGKSCAGYLTGIECNKEEGSYWISDEQLLNSVTEIHYIKD